MDPSDIWIPLVSDGPALDCLMAGQPSWLLLVAKDLHGNCCVPDGHRRWEARLDRRVHGGTVAWTATGEPVPSDGLRWENCDPPTFTRAAADAGDFYLHLQPEVAAPHVLTIRQVLSGTPAAEALEAPLHVCPGWTVPASFAVIGGDPHTAVVGETSKLQLCPRSFGPAHHLASTLFDGLRAWVEYPDAGALLPVLTHRRMCNATEQDAAGWLWGGGWERREVWELGVESHYAARNALLHVQLFGSPIAGAPFELTILRAQARAQHEQIEPQSSQVSHVSQGAIAADTAHNRVASHMLGGRNPYGVGSSSSCSLADVEEGRPPPYSPASQSAAHSGNAYADAQAVAADDAAPCAGCRVAGEQLQEGHEAEACNVDERHHGQAVDRTDESIRRSSWPNHSKAASSSTEHVHGNFDFDMAADDWEERVDSDADA